MAIDVERLDGGGAERWDDLVERSPHRTPFHRYSFLEVVAAHSDATLYPMIGYKGQEPVGLFPWFEISVGPVSTLFSPPPDLKITYLGPALVNHEKLKQRKAERRHRSFVEGCLDELGEAVDPRYIHVRTSRRYTDSRPLVWSDFDADPAFTYLVDLDRDEEALLDSFSSDARRNVRTADDADVTVEEGGVEAVESIITQVKERHDAQGEPYAVTTDFVTDLYEQTPDGTVRPYVCRVEGEFAGGMVALELGETIYRWQGGAKPDADLPVNDYLDWRIMQDAMDRGLRWYDLVGAGTPRLCEYKAKFAPTLDTHQSLERSTRGMKVASNLYKRLR